MTPLQTGLILSFFAFFLGLLTNAMIAFFKSGQVEKKAAYTLEDNCEKRREECCIAVIENQMATIDIRLKETEKQLDRGREDFRLLRADIGEIKMVLSGMKAIMENKIETITFKPKG